MLNDAQEAARLEWVVDEGDDHGGCSTDSNQNYGEPAEEMAWDFHELRASGRRVMPALQSNLDHCRNYNVREQINLVETQVITEEEITAILRAVELTDQLAETKETCSTYMKEHKTEATWLTDLLFRKVLL